MSGAQQHTYALSKQRLRIAFALTAAILVVEAAGGAVSHSLALLSDSGHVLTDLVALGLAWFAMVQSERPANARKTYGYHRTGILVALANAMALILIVLAIAFEAIRRLQQPPHVTPWIMFVAAGLALAANLYIALGLRHAGSENLNLRAALLHVTGDLAASLGVLVAGVVILFTGWYLLDPILSLLIALLIAVGAWNILRETVDILMEGTPKDLNVAQLVRDIVREPEIVDVHDLHVWSIAGGMLALSAHVQVRDCRLSECDKVLVKLNRILQEVYGIGHSTIQLECAGCNPNDLYCTLSPEGDKEHQHAHGGDGLHSHDLIGGGRPAHE
jgi:cobalt-zinc-cadmium efflux system protein